MKDFDILHIAIILACGIIGAYATTDILRLLKGSRMAVNESNCYCFLCGSRLSVWDQIPVIGYLLNRGRCHYCHRRIPSGDLFLELLLSVSMICISLWTRFSWKGFFLCFGLYECVKAGSILKMGHREERFVQNLLYSIVFNLIIFSLLAFLFLLCQLVR